MLTLLRVLLYVQVLLGLGRFARLIRGPVWESHFGIGTVIAILALIALRPVAGDPSPATRAWARFVPLLPLATGLVIFAEVTGGASFTVLHMLLGLASIALVERVAARSDRSVPGR